MCHPAMPADRAALASRPALIKVAVTEGALMPVALVAPDGGPATVDDTLGAGAGAGGSDAPTVVVVADIYGPSDFYLDLCARLAARGLRAALPDIFFRQGPLAERSFEAAVARRAGLDESGALGDLRALIAGLRDGRGGGGTDGGGGGASPTPVGVLGFCMGGTLALDLAALEDALAVVAYYGFPVPQTTLVSPPPAPLDLAPRMRGPVLAFWGDRDEAVGGENVSRFVEAMRTSPAEFEHRVYAGLGHAFLAQSQLPDEPAGDDDAGQSWQLTLRYFGRHLVPPQP
ncbi:MAG: dienelactone hydrolase family protein [Solirubrobacteraceae bacterium]